MQVAARPIEYPPPPLPHGCEPFRVDVRPDRGALHVIPVGELDIATVDQVDESLCVLRGAGAGRLVLDLRELTFMGLTGVTLLVDRNDEARRGEFSFIAGPATDRVLEITGWDARLPIRAV